jgi:hypothetical protein
MGEPQVTWKGNKESERFNKNTVIIFTISVYLATLHKKRLLSHDVVALKNSA